MGESNLKARPKQTFLKAINMFGKMLNETKQLSSSDRGVKREKAK